MRFLLSLVFIIASIVSSGQIHKDIFPDNDTSGIHKTNIDPEEMDAYLNPKKLKFNLELGSSFGTGAYGSYFGTYVAPSISYPVNSRFTISGGGYFAGISPIAQGENGTGTNNPFGAMYTRSFLFVKGAYRLTDNLIISGAAYKEIDMFSTNRPPVPGSNYENHGFIMGVDYKIGDNVFIRGSVEVSNGNRPSHYSPFMNPGSSRMFDPFFSH